jgi:hypothetical protein
MTACHFPFLAIRWVTHNVVSLLNVLMFKFLTFIQLSFLCTFFLQEDQIGFISSFSVVVESRKARDLCFRKPGVSPSRQLKHINDFRDGLLRNLDPSSSSSWPWGFSHPCFTPRESAYLNLFYCGASSATILSWHFHPVLRLRILYRQDVHVPMHYLIVRLSERL